MTPHLRPQIPPSYYVIDDDESAIWIHPRSCFFLMAPELPVWMLPLGFQGRVQVLVPMQRVGMSCPSSWAVSMGIFANSYSSK
jgi:hypothetical protein